MPTRSAPKPLIRSNTVLRVTLIRIVPRWASWRQPDAAAGGRRAIVGSPATVRP
jgi:hypothetical protein